MKNKFLNYFVFLFFLFILNMNFCYADTYIGKIEGTGVNLRSGPGTNYDSVKSVSNGNIYTLVSNELIETEEGCSSGWYKIYYESEKTGYVCSNYLKVSLTSDYIDVYERPWTTPKSAIIGGAKFITTSYIDKGQFTSYLKKFNVNPEAAYKVYNHQYMANLQAPYSEAYSSYKSYKDNSLLELPLEFTIPVYENMPEYTKLPESELEITCKSEVTDEAFEKILNQEEFPESYRCKLRLIHDTYSNWTFKAMHTGLDFEKSVLAEQNVSSIQGGDKYYDLSGGSKVETEKNWFRANYDTVSYYLDPRNFLVEERILMFEHLGYSENYTETVVQSILKGTFMEEYSLIDNETYASMFVKAGIEANISSVYLASLARQESGANGSVATSGEEFTYKNITYKGLYNFYNIGASSGAESPILAGLVWASGGSNDVIINNPIPDTPEVADPEVISESTILEKLGTKVDNGCLIDFNIGTTLGSIKEKLNELNLVIEDTGDEDVLKTGQLLTISQGNTTFTYTISIKGDVDGDGLVGATDYVKIKNYIMEKSDSELNISQSLAADVDNNAEIGATDYVKIKNSIMES